MLLTIFIVGIEGGRGNKSGFVLRSRFPRFSRPGFQGRQDRERKGNGEISGGGFLTDAIDCNKKDAFSKGGLGVDWSIDQTELVIYFIFL